MTEYHIYGHDQCPFCVKAKELLVEKGVDYHVYNIRRDESAKEFFDKHINLRKVPQVLLYDDNKNFTLIGGYDMLVKHFNDMYDADDLF